MACNFTQGSALPNIKTTQTQTTTAPTFYTDYLSQLAKCGASAATNAQFVGAQPLQQQAFNQVGANVGNYQPALNSAMNAANQVTGTNLACAIGDYGHANIAANLAPQATAGIVGAGQFGSSRGAGALGQVLANADLGITQQQQQALQQCQANKLAAANVYNNIATNTSQLGMADVNALSTLGAQCQAIKQNAQLFPMQQLTNESQLLRGFNVPTSTTSTYCGPIPGAYSASPLQNIAGIGALAAGISCTALGKAIGNGLGSMVGSIPWNKINWCQGMNPADVVAKSYDPNTSIDQITGGNYGPTPTGGNIFCAGCVMDYSDIRMKENIVRIGTLPSGLPFYKFEYKPGFKSIAGHGAFVGVMAQEAEKVIPEAVATMPNGYKAVKYSLIK